MFRFDGSRWIERQKLTASDAGASDRFGESVALSGNTAIVAAGGNDEAGDNAGAVYVFGFDGSQWIQQQKLIGSDTAQLDGFGDSVALSGNSAMVGARRNDEAGPNAGAVYVFRHDGSRWVEDQKLMPSDAAEVLAFGRSVTFDGQFAIMGAGKPTGPGSTGVAYVFRHDGNQWVEQQMLTAFPPIAADKRPLRPGQKAGFTNYTSYHRGINGIIVDLAHPDWTVDEGDFIFKVGNDNNPTAWGNAPPPSSVTVRPGEGVGGSDRVTITWPDGAIRNQWLQVTVLPGGNTGLWQPDVFYFGNAMGESGNSTTDAKVNAFDMLGARDNQRTFLDPAPIDFRFDYDRDQRVSVTDMLIARNNQTHFLNALNLITVPSAKAAEGGNHEARMTNDEQASSSLVIRVSGFLDGLHEFDRNSEQNRRSGRDDPARQSVDRLLATWGHD